MKLSIIKVPEIEMAVKLNVLDFVQINGKAFHLIVPHLAFIPLLINHVHNCKVTLKHTWIP